jgi:hypothetical protein
VPPSEESYKKQGATLQDERSCFVNSRAASTDGTVTRLPHRTDGKNVYGFQKTKLWERQASLGKVLYVSVINEAGMLLFIKLLQRSCYFCTTMFEFKKFFLIPT